MVQGPPDGARRDHRGRLLIALNRCANGSSRLSARRQGEWSPRSQPSRSARRDIRRRAPTQMTPGPTTANIHASNAMTPPMTSNTPARMRTVDPLSACDRPPNAGLAGRAWVRLFCAATRESRIPMPKNHGSKRKRFHRSKVVMLPPTEPAILSTMATDTTAQCRMETSAPTEATPRRTGRQGAERPVAACECPEEVDGDVPDRPRGGDDTGTASSRRSGVHALGKSSHGASGHTRNPPKGGAICRRVAHRAELPFEPSLTTTAS